MQSEYLRSLLLVSPDVGQRYQLKLKIVNDVDSFTLNISDLDNSIQGVPPITNMVIVSYLVLTQSFCSKDQMKSYKSLQAYKYFEAGLVTNVGTKVVNDFYIVVGKLTLIAAISMFFGTTACTNMPHWYPYLFPICLGISIFVQSIFYLVFSCGLSVTKPSIWIKMDILSNTILSILAIIASVTTYNECNQDEFQRATGAIGIAGGVILLIGCAAIFLFYRYKQEDATEEPQTIVEQLDPRKSMHA